VAADSARNSGEPSEPAISQSYRRFAALLKADRATILASYANNLEELHSSVIGDPRARDQTMLNAAEAIADIEASLEVGGVRIDDRYRTLAWTIGRTRAENQLNPADSLRAAMVFFDVVVSSLARHVREDVELLPCFVTAVLALNESINLRVRDATLAYTEYLLDRIHHAHLDERRRIARDLHDRLGEGLSVALRQLEIYEIGTRREPPRSESGSWIVKDALSESMRRLRIVTSDLRQDSVTGLEKALISYVESAATDVNITLRVSGDETWASPTVIDETFLIIREAIRNALAHGDPEKVLVLVAVAPHELRAWVDDDGRGFQPAMSRDPVFAGTGLASMQERAALIAGRLTVASTPGQGTRVELIVPLSGNRDASTI
jgi:signal transduction histidine kinase